jgi:hypothetical protein
MKQTDDGKLFTPYIHSRTTLRAYMRLSEADAHKVGTHDSYRAEVTDQVSGRQFIVRDADCGLGCHCAAVIVRETKS